LSAPSSSSCEWFFPLPLVIRPRSHHPASELVHNSGSNSIDLATA
jgi:hypothetical protein